VNIFKDVHIGGMVDTIFQSDVTIRLCEQWYLRKTSAGLVTGVSDKLNLDSKLDLTAHRGILLGGSHPV